jgi:methionyl-tRNA synthetase
MQRQIEAFIEGKPHWKPNVLGQVGSWLKEGLRDRAITRDVPWGVPVPERAAALAGVDATGKVIYVWFDAPIGYISATREWAAELGKPELWKSYWQDPGTRLIHFIGKDNIVFHCIMFPAMLMAHGDYVLPADVPANEFLNIEGRKLSTSRGWAVWLHEYLEELQPDLLRYALASTLPETKDADFSWSEFQARVNNELADVLGNFANRTITFAQRYFKREVPGLTRPSNVHTETLAALADFRDSIGSAYESFRNREAVFQTIALARLGNKFFNDTEPWRMVKVDPPAAGDAIHVALQILASLSILMDPVLPFAARELRRMLNMPDVVDSGVPSGTSTGLGWDQAGSSLLEAGHQLGEPVILFEKIEDEVVARWVERLGSPVAATASDTNPGPGPANFEPAKDEIPFDVFQQLDLRAGTIIAADRVPRADKLLRLDVDLGYETRQIISGIAEHYAPADLVGRRVVVVANLQPRKLRGLSSAGMLLTSEEPDGTLRLVGADGVDGSIIR